MIPMPLERLSDLLPARGRPRFADLAERQRYLRDYASTAHTTLTVGNTQTTTATEPTRLRSVQVDGGVSGGTVTVQVQVDGRDMFLDGVRPVSGSTAAEATDRSVFPSGAVISTVIEASSGAPTGTANVVIDTEPFALTPYEPLVPLSARDRLHRSRRGLLEQERRRRRAGAPLSSQLESPVIEPKRASVVRRPNQHVGVIFATPNRTSIAPSPARRTTDPKLPPRTKPRPRRGY